MRSLALVLFCLPACLAKPVLVVDENNAKNKTESKGVTLAADPDAWNGSPKDLGRFAAPIAVRLTNNGETPILVRGEDFVLAAPNGWRVRRLVPRTPHDSSVSHQDKPALPPGASIVFSQPTLLAPIFPSEERFAWVRLGDFWIYHGPRIYFEEPIANYGTPEDFYLVAQPAPKNDIAPLALDEGVLDPGATREGFLYFNLPPNGVAALTLRWHVVGVQNESDEPPPKIATLALHFCAAR